MKRILALVLWLLAGALIFLLDNDRFEVPALGSMLSPGHGVWESPSGSRARTSLEIPTPYGTSSVYYDERAVPHIFAPNDQALYYAQGYVQAMDRLWQMDLQVRVAAGRLSEVIGERGVPIDRMFRRMGIPRSARATADSMAASGDDMFTVMITPFSEGINAYISSLSRAELPAEYKMVHYTPEPWTPEKCVLLLKLMSYRLTGADHDIANTNNLRVMDRATFDGLFPDQPRDISPIIPAGTDWKFDPVEASAGHQQDMTASSLPELHGLFPELPKAGLGSNNWAVGRQRTADGGSILCNDPHLGLSLPSIWYEMQLHTPDLNVYGVTIPGAPSIIIGFNEHMAWGVTNASRDVRDWYRLQYQDETQRSYLFGGEFLPVERHVETIKVKHRPDVKDTVSWTVVGPVMYDDTYGSQESARGLAVHWVALEVSNEIRTFYQLNRARDHSDFRDALQHYHNPGQNFVFADRKGNVGIKEQGRFRLQAPGAGKFIEDLSSQDPDDFWKYIPFAHNPQVYNPDQGFVSSANQHPTDSTYPYFYSGMFETYRNRRINQMLRNMTDVTVEQMMEMQVDNYNLMATEILPFLLDHLDVQALDEASAAVADTLIAWDFQNDARLRAPAYFQQWWDHVMEATWDELRDSSIQYRVPRDYHTYHFLRDHPGHALIDHEGTDERETVSSIVNQAFGRMAAHFGSGQHRPEWQYHNGSSVNHLMNFPGFGRRDIPAGGSENSINANSGGFGPSWRMIVRLNGQGVEGYGVYPGGPSGHPGSPDYDAFLDAWAEGRYFKLNFYSSPEEALQDTKQP